MTLTVLKDEETGVWSLKVHETLHFDNIDEMLGHFNSYLSDKSQFGGKIEQNSTKPKKVK